MIYLLVISMLTNVIFFAACYRMRRQLERLQARYDDQRMRHIAGMIEMANARYAAEGR